MKKEKRTAFGKDIYLLGADKEGTKYWLEGASFDCGWYWGFGYVETYTNNNNPGASRDILSHQHFDTLFLKNYGFDDVLEATTMTEGEKWKLMELMKTYYNLKLTAEVFGRGGSHVSSNPLCDEIKDEELVKKINNVLLPKVFEEVYKILSPEA